ncbi:MAG TPA: hypothetical protein PLW88_07480 [Syntrophorhabdaceae bacterium]|nr:hypothetical protein [Syntrophorhabdaceae bacterium]
MEKIEIRQNKPSPWMGNELKRLWATARGVGMTHEDVYNAIKIQFGKERLHELTRQEFIKFLFDTAKKHPAYKTWHNRSELDEHFKDTPMEPSWRYIRFLQRRLGWSDEILAKYIAWHGKKIGTNIDNIKWLTVQKAHGVITGMKKILEGKNEK